MTSDLQSANTFMDRSVLEILQQSNKNVPLRSLQISKVFLLQSKRAKQSSPKRFLPLSQASSSLGGSDFLTPSVVALHEYSCLFTHDYWILFTVSCILLWQGAEGGASNARILHKSQVMCANLSAKGIYHLWQTGRGAWSFGGIATGPSSATFSSQLFCLGA